MSSLDFSRLGEGKLEFALPFSWYVKLEWAGWDLTMGKRKGGQGVGWGNHLIRALKAKTKPLVCHDFWSQSSSMGILDYWMPGSKPCSLVLPQQRRSGFSLNQQKRMLFTLPFNFFNHFKTILSIVIRMKNVAVAELCAFP